VTESQNAARALSLLGTNASAAIPDLVAALGDENFAVTRNAANALASMGTNALGPLRERLPRAQVQEQIAILFTLASMQTNAAPAAPDIAALLESESTPVADMAAFTLGSLGPDAAPAITNFLTSTNSKILIRALQALAQLGPHGASASNEVVRLIQSPDPALRLHARMAFASTYPPKEFAQPIWVAGLRDPDPHNLEVSLRNLTMYPGNVREFNREIAALTSHPTNIIRVFASNALTTFRAWPTNK
jgi:HEAT repeat protein